MCCAELATTAARLLIGIGAMPAAAASSQELLEKAQALHSMLSELQHTVTAVRLYPLFSATDCVLTIFCRGQR